LDLLHPALLLAPSPCLDILIRRSLLFGRVFLIAREVSMCVVVVL
jgi:hypothetical protein